MQNKISILILSGLLISSQKAFCEVDPRIETSVREYTQQVVYGSLLQTTSEIIGNALSKNNLNILPPVAMQAIQQTVLQCFKQEATKDTVRSAFEAGVDFGIAQIKNGSDQANIQNGIRAVVDRELEAVIKNPIYQRIIEEMLKQAYTQSQRLMVMQAAQQRMQIAAIEQQQRVIQQAMVQQYQKAIQQQLSQQMSQQLNQQANYLYQQQANLLQAQESVYRQQLLQQQQHSSGGLY